MKEVPNAMPEDITPPDPPSPPRGGLRERNAERMREQIFTAAIELFAARGHANVTIEQITARARVGKGTFFNYFSSKEAILTYFGGNQVERLQSALEGGTITGSPRERLCGILEVLSTHPSFTPELARGLFISALSNTQFNEMEGNTIWHIQGIIGDVIREGQEQGDFRSDTPPEQAAHFLFGQFFLALLNWCTGFSDRSLSDTVQCFASLALEGFVAERETPAAN